MSEKPLPKVIRLKERTVQVDQFPEVQESDKTVAIQNLLKDKLVKIIQDPELRCYAGAKGLQINIQVVGDKAVELALRSKEQCDIEDSFSAMQFVLGHLPQPKMEYLKMLAVVTAVKKEGLLDPAAKYLGISTRHIRYMRDNVKALGLPIDEYLSPEYYKHFRGKSHGRNKIQDSRELPEET